MANLIGLMGAMGSGKTTAAKWFAKLYGFRQVSFADALRDMVKKITPDGEIVKSRDRELLQYIGTDYFRQKVDPDYWVKSYIQSVQGGDGNIVTDDIRFPNEAEAVHGLGGTLIYLEISDPLRRKNLENRDGELATGIDGHISENSEVLRSYADFVVVNDRTLSDFYQDLTAVYTLVRKE